VQSVSFHDNPFTPEIERIPTTMPTLTIEGHGSFDVPQGRRLAVAIEENGFDILHRCGGFAKCTTCRVVFTAGEPARMTRAEYDKLEEKDSLGDFRLSCQCSVTEDMAVRPLLRWSTSGLDDPGPELEPDITPEPEWIATPAPGLAWPQDAEAWRAALARILRQGEEEARERYLAGTLPRETIAGWLGARFSAARGYEPDFAPALVRNLDGLLRWAFGDGPEPLWSGSDAAGQGSGRAG